MQGGVTSGVVYPGLVCKLAEYYDFQSIGGTSAGAIAAALTAAAEYSRRAGNPDAFNAVSEVPGWLGVACAETEKVLRQAAQTESNADNGRSGNSRDANEDC